MGSPTSRTLQLFKKDNWLIEVTEKFNCFTKQRKDLFGFIDLIAIRSGLTVGIQATSTPNMSARIKKIKGECFQAALKWLQAGNVIIVIGWSKKKNRWVEKIVEITAETF